MSDFVISHSRNSMLPFTRLALRWWRWILVALIHNPPKVSTFEKVYSEYGSNWFNAYKDESGRYVFSDVI